jgi:hypothetical protein
MSITINVNNHRANKESQLIGTGETFLRQMDESNDLIQLKDQPQKIVETIMFYPVHIERISTFLDYLRTDLQLILITAIDLTGSNGNTSSSHSLHYSDSKNMN